ncbi:MAG: AEC family transporter [Muribaculaceae bacterium]|nr:AEC family transporter [Muribaculaceae bacterium]
MLHIILYAIVPIFVVMALGFFSGKAGAFSGQDARVLNKVVLNYALPCALFVSIVKANRAMLAVDAKLTAIAFIVLIACFYMVYYVFKFYKGNTSADAAIAALVSGSPTIGFLGFAVLEPIFGTSASVGLVIAIVAIEVNAIGIPIGLCLLNNANAAAAAAQNGGKKPNPWGPVINALKQPVAWAPILAVILVLCGVKWPASLNPSFTLMAGANASLACFAAGITLSSVKVSLNAQVWLGAFLRLIATPLLVLVVGLFFHMEPLNLKMLVIASALPPAMSGIIIASRYNVYVATSTSSLAVSTLLFMGTCPMWLWLCDVALKMFG